MLTLAPPTRHDPTSAYSKLLVITSDTQKGVTYVMVQSGWSAEVFLHGEGRGIRAIARKTLR